MGLLSFATLKGKMTIAVILISILSGFGFYAWNLNQRVDSLKLENSNLTTSLNSANDTIKEMDRRVEVVDQVSSIAEKERIIIRKEYLNKIEKIDTMVKENKDRPVGPLLNEFFNE